MNLILLCLLAAGFAGVIVCGGTWLVTAFSEGTYTLGRLVAAIAAAVTLILVAPLGAHIGTNVSAANASKFSEFWNGYEVAAESKRTPCERDGDCERTYECDHYWETEYYTETDSEGNTVQKSRQVEKHHDCPEATEEFDYWVKTTLGTYTIVSGGFSADPKEWRRGEGLSKDVHRGEPARWLEVRDRINRGDPGPVTERHDYDNYILASQSTLLTRYSDDIEMYKSQNLLPAPAGEIHDHYHADKASFVGYSPDDPGKWQSELARLNAAAGSQLQGDVHLVLVSADVIDNPDSYAGALAAHWQSKAFGKEALSKNGIGVVVGIKDEKVVWGRAFTGMPLGNEGLMQDIQSSLKDRPATTEAVIGHPVAALGEGEGFEGGVKLTHGTGAIETALWGPNKFVRVSMKGGGEEGPGYKYLKAELEPTSSERTTIASIVFVLSLLVWGVAAFVQFTIREKAGYGKGRSYGYYR